MYRSTLSTMVGMKLTKCYSLLLLTERATSFRLLSLSSSSSHGRRYYSFRRTSIEPYLTQPLHAKKSFDYSSDVPYEILPLQEVIENLTARTTGASTAITVDEHLKTGLSNEDFTKILEEVGPNALEPPVKKSIWELWLQQFDGKISLFLLLPIIMFCVIGALCQVGHRYNSGETLSIHSHILTIEHFTHHQMD
jgi:hypothetical protein